MMLMMRLERGFAADAHDARPLSLAWKGASQLMLMMLAPFRWLGKGLRSDAHDARPLSACKRASQLMLMMHAAFRWLWKGLRS